ncbi:MULTISPECIES: flagellar hook-basal body complex protein FliE [Proteiniclasticum]|jgi:flagellar hook-basal body complex protein FliE|uniref:Flagellar hook-basal body complex protein FliE n=2 Tax=Proteiniclasticum ruminis TaxID=398199 RepID=A0A1I5C9J7_9CLOT|nr:MULTISPECIES: flagellar hook-basal body complex protein FliE [Proteiniclasticum]MBP9921139.1 flagellar hook-basal body complex protein FliE [Proteiniclasticum sp.]SFN83669.1 flagellar hook-basal body complex protein FliE [Proteiniclasticum ruminis]HBW13692.1 flagellar hook-basal body complex protein FliE [Proteiniclasticum sp.]
MTNISGNYKNILDRYSLLLNQTGKAERKEEADFSSLGLGESFGDLLTSQVEKLNMTQLSADQMVSDFAAGKTDDLHNVMIGVEEARLSMELAVQVRNKIIEAYKELTQMQL